MSPALCGAAQSQLCPGPLTSPSRRMRFPEAVSKKELSLRESWATCHLSPHSPLCSQPEVPGLNSHMGSSTAPLVHGHGRGCSKEVTAHGSWDRPAHQRGHPDAPYPVAHMSDKLKRHTKNKPLWGLPDLVLLVKKKKIKKKVFLTLTLHPGGRLGKQDGILTKST